MAEVTQPVVAKKQRERTKVFVIAPRGSAVVAASHKTVAESIAKELSVGEAVFVVREVVVTAQRDLDAARRKAALAALTPEQATALGLINKAPKKKASTSGGAPAAPPPLPQSASSVRV